MQLPTYERVRHLLLLTGLFWGVGLSVFLAYIIGLAYAQGGQITLNMTLFDEQHIEYWLMVLVVPIITLALFYTIELLPSIDDPPGEKE